MCISRILGPRGQRPLAVHPSRFSLLPSSASARSAIWSCAWWVWVAVLALGVELTGCVTRLGEELRGSTEDETTDQRSEPSPTTSTDESRTPDASTGGGGQPDATNGTDGGLDGSWEGGMGVPPMLESTLPANGSTDVAPDVNITLTFDMPVQPGEGTVRLYRTADDALVEMLDIAHARVTFLQDSVTIDWETTLRAATQYYLVLEAGAVLSSAGVPHGGFTDELSFTTRQPSPLLVVSKSPLNEAQDVDPNSKLVLTFSEMIQAGSGEFSLHAWNEQEDENQLVERFEVDSESVIINDSAVTLEPSSSLDYSTRYFVLADEGVIVSLMGAPYEGIAGSSAWTFVTAEAAPAPLVLDEVEPNNGETGVAIDSTIALIFDQPIRSGSGTITIYVAGTGEPFEAAEVSDARVAVSANRAEFAPDSDFDYATEYYVLVSAGAFESRDGASFEGISSSSRFTFTTTGTLPSCDGNEVMREGTRDCYYLGTSAVAWPAAREACQDRGDGWDLASIRSPQEQQFIESLIVAETWIGATDAEEDGNWRWIRDDSPFWSGNRDGSAVSGAYVRWLTDEPSGGTIPPEECARLVNKGSGWYWADVSCGNSYQYVCQGPAD